MKSTNSELSPEDWGRAVLVSLGFLFFTYVCEANDGLAETSVVVAIFSESLADQNVGGDVEAFKSMAGVQKEIVAGVFGETAEFRTLGFTSGEKLGSQLLDLLDPNEKIAALIFFGHGILNEELSLDKKNAFTGAELAEQIVCEPVIERLSRGQVLVYFPTCSLGFSTRSNKGFQDQFMDRAATLNDQMPVPANLISTVAHPYFFNGRAFFLGISELSYLIHKTGVYRLIQSLLIQGGKRVGTNKPLQIVMELLKEPVRSMFAVSLMGAFVILAPEDMESNVNMMDIALGIAGLKILEFFQIGTTRTVEFSSGSFRVKHLPAAWGVRQLLRSHLRPQQVACRSVFSS